MLGARLLGAGRDLVAALTAAGVPASLTRAEVQTPGAWVTPQTLDLTTLGGDGTARFHVVFVVSDQDDAAALVALAGLLDKAVAALLVPAEPVDTSWALVLPHTQTPLPAWRMAVDWDL